MKLENRVKYAASTWVLRDLFSKNPRAGRAAGSCAATFSGSTWQAGLVAAARYCCLAALALLILAACHRDELQVATFTAAAAHTASWSIRNTSDRDIRFNLTVNDKFWRSRQQMIDEIARQNNDNQTFVIRAAEWVHRYSRNISPLSADNWIHSPELFINSLGLGYCDDRAAVLVSLWQAYGLRTRMWNLQGHVVPEVMVNGKWQLHDPDMGVFMLGDDLQICSVADVAAGCARYYEIDGQRHPIDTIQRSLLLIDKYVSTADNQLSDWYHASELQVDSLFRLPPAASIHCCNTRPGAPQAYLLELRLPPASQGVLSVPLVLAAFPPSLRPMFPKVDSLYGAVQISNRHPDTLSLYYHVNPYILATQQHNKLVMRGKKVDQLVVSWQERSRAYSPPRYLDDFRNLYLSNPEMAALVRTLPMPLSFDQLPMVFRQYYQLQGVSAEALALREQAFMPVFRLLLPFAQSRPAIEKLFLQNQIYQILLFELCQTLDPQDVLTYINNLSL